MKKIFFISLALLAAHGTMACDVCGCSLGGSYFGILPQFNKNFVGLRWSQARFHAYMNHQSDYLKPETSNDTYQKLELWGRYYVNKRIQLFAFIPYSFNSMKGTEQVVSSHGLGDITVIGNYLLLNTGEDKTKKFKHTWMAGAGVKLPTGDSNLEDKGVLVNPNFQLGTGSLDFLLSTVYTLRYQKAGLSVESGYKINTRNRNDYVFGNQFHASSQVFYWQNAGVFAFLPNAGVYFEQAAKHRDGTILQANTGGSSVQLMAGLETYVKGFTVGFTYKHPVNQHYNSDNIADITAKDSWSLSLTYNF
ncbi:MAG: hypothetical protein JNK18_11530 [Cyclobacteriaceae bacterium]|nr:hypothetical protein [Cyclobacteriaceae bacterium]